SRRRQVFGSRSPKYSCNWPGFSRRRMRKLLRKPLFALFIHLRAFQRGEKAIEARNSVKSEKGRERETADDRYGHRYARFSAGTEIECFGNRPGNRRDGGHENRTKPDGAGV